MSIAEPERRTSGSFLPEHALRRKYLFVASTGGHLAQLKRFSASMNSSPDSLWITTRTPQSESLLKDQRSLFLPYVGARDPLGVFRVFLAAREALAGEGFDIAVSTGSAFALGVFLAAALRRIPRTFIESVSRVNGPSLTGRIVHRLHLAELRTQHQNWADARWKAHPSVLSRFESRPNAKAAPAGDLRIFVTLGTFRKYRFDSLVDAMLRTGLCGPLTTWQLGITTRDALPGEVHVEIPAADFDARIREADVVVTHAGVGTLLSLLEAGVYPVVVPRRRSRGEHVDDHQMQIADLLNRLGLAAVVQAGELTATDLREAAATRVIPM